jgi:signal transduction histidine kinase
MQWQKGKRRVLLFLVVILPAAVLVGLAVRVFRQEAELANKREVDQRREALEQVRRELSTRLEAIKLEEVNRLRDESAQPGLRHAPDSPVIFILPIEQDRIVMPWEGSGTSAERTPQSAESRRQGERQEFELNNPAAAVEAYRKAFTSARTTLEKCETELGLARALTKAGRAGDSSRIYHTMVGTCESAMDDDGISFSLYAAERLIATDLDVAAARQYALAIAKENRWSPPTQLYLLRSLLNPVSTNEARRVCEAISDQIDDVEQLIGLAREFRGVSLFRVNWFAFGSQPWLVTMMSPIPNTTPFVLAVSAKKVAPPGTVLTGTHSESSTPLGEGFRDVDLEWHPGKFPAVRRPPVALYWAGLVLILGATGLAGYLLMRDLNREVHTATLRAQFVASVSHELKTPLTAIRMFAETLALGRAKNEQSRSEYLQTIVNESERLSRLVDNVLDFSRLENGKKIYRMELVSLDSVVRAAARAMQYPLSQQEFHLALSIDPEVPPLMADGDALEQAILNLLTNAMKYSGDCRDIQLCLRRTTDAAAIDVTDQGIGIPVEEHVRIFEKFYRVRSTSNVAGTGLGLTLALHIVRAHGGTIEVKSAVGVGSTFSVIIPFERRERLA